MHELWLVDPSFIPTLEKLDSATPQQVAEARSLFDGQDLPSILTIDGENATIEINGVITKNGPSHIARFFGIQGASYMAILESIDTIMEDPSIKRVAVKADSPGGTVQGVDITFQAFMKLRKHKRLIFENHGMMASAMYYLASSGHKIRAVAPDAESGSVGVVIAGVSFKKMDEKFGVIEYTILSANAPDKAPDPLTKKGARVLQDRVDSLERVFMQRIHEGRGISVDTIKKDFGRGALLIAQDPDGTKPDAISVGMIDGLVSGAGISKFEDTAGADAEHLEDIGTGESTAVDTQETGATESQPRVVDNNKSDKGGKKMPLKELMAEDAALAAEVKARDDENVKLGAQQGVDRIEARVAAAAPYLSDTKYPAAIHTLAAAVAAGTQEPAALIGAVTVLDAQAEAAASAEAQEEAEALEETAGAESDDTAGANANYSGKKERLTALGA